MAIEVWTLTLTYDGGRLLVNDRAHPHGAHDIGVAPWASKPTAIVPQPDMDEDVADEVYEAVYERAVGLRHQLRAAWTGTEPLF